MEQELEDKILERILLIQEIELFREDGSLRLRLDVLDSEINLLRNKIKDSYEYI